MSWSWSKLQQHVKVLLTAVAPAVVVGLAFYAIYVALLLPVWWEAFSSDGSPSPAAEQEARDLFSKMAILYAVLVVTGLPLSILQANLVRICLVIADGGTPTYRMIVNPRRAGRIVLTTIVLGLGALVGTILCILPAIAFLVFAMFTVPVMLDRDLSTFAAMRASFSLVRQQFWLCVLTTLVAGGILYVGSLVCLVGMAVTMPLSTLIVVYAYRALVRGPIAP